MYETFNETPENPIILPANRKLMHQKQRSTVENRILFRLNDGDELAVFLL